LTKPIPRVYTTRFFQLITTRQFAEAERILERVKQKMRVTERNRGYFQALYGMFLAQRNNDDRYAFLSGLDFTDLKQLKKCRHEFLNQSESRLHAEYDRGFFEAWADFMKILPKLQAPPSTVNNKSVQTVEKTLPESTPISKEGSEAETRDMAIAQEKERIQPEMLETAKSRSEQSVKPSQSTLLDYAQ
jgi:hypothetical protein